MPKKLKTLQEEARAILNTPPKAIKEIELELELGKYFLDDLYKDFQDSIENKDLFAAELIKHKIVTRSIDLFLKKHQVRKDKDKRLKKQLKEIDAEFSAALKSFMQNNSFVKLQIALEKILGEWRPKEWVLKSDLTC